MYTQVYGITEFGPADSLTSKQFTLNDIQPGYVRLRVISASVNPIDVKTRAGLGFVAAAKNASDFLGLGYDVYGEVIDASSEHQDKIGQHAVGMVGFPSKPGCYATHIDAHVDELVFLDAAKANVKLGGLSLAGLTALQALDKLKEYDTIYILAPTGGVGHLAIQIAALQHKKVVAVTTRPDHEALTLLANKLGLTVVSYDAFFTSKVKGGCIDLVGGETGKKVAANFELGSKVITVPTITKDAVMELAASVGIHADGVVVKAQLEQLTQLVAWFEHGQLDILEGQRFSLFDVAMAHQKMESGNYSGKLLIVV